MVVFEIDDSPERMETGPSPSSPLAHRIAIESLEAISGVIERLNHLGIAIRQSPVTRQTAKTRKFAETFDSTSFEDTAHHSLKVLYPDANESLIEQLTRSMTETYTRFLRRKLRQAHLQTARSQFRISVPLYPVAEEPTADDNAGNSIDGEIQATHYSRDLAVQVLRSPLRQSISILSQSEPTSVDSREFKAKFKRTMSPTVKDKALSVLAGPANYPRPLNGDLACDWCFSPIPKDSLEETKWQYDVLTDSRLLQDRFIFLIHQILGSI